MSDPTIITVRGLQYHLTAAYLKGAWDCQNGKCSNPFAPGPELAQYSYGWQNETLGDHDDIDLPFAT